MIKAHVSFVMFILVSICAATAVYPAKFKFAALTLIIKLNIDSIVFCRAALELKLNLFHNWSFMAIKQFTLGVFFDKKKLARALF